MKIAKTILLVLLILLSIATGVTKLIQMPEEMELFRGAGFPDILTIVFGVVQVAGGLLLIPKNYRHLGARVMLATFCIATVVVFINEMMAFGFSSMLFILMTVPFLKKQNT